MPIKSKHPKATKFINSGLFEGIRDFSQLEVRIASIEGDKDKGDAFEVFAEAYLATQRKHEAAEIWPSSEVPTDTIEELRLPSSDMGIDGVFRTRLDSYCVYQVKFRTNRPAITWREISTFMGLSDAAKIENRVLITNCDSITNVVEQRNGFYCVRGTDLDRLSENDFNNILSWIKGETLVAKKKLPQQHQIDAVKAICTGLDENKRVTATMACGTGKTLVALWVAEALKAKKILLLFPSLALIRQTLHEWLKETKIEKLTYICVCSDRTVAEGADMPSTSRADLDFSVTTNVETVKEYLAKDQEGTKIVFSTYQSAKLIGNALAKGDAFDLAIFDEAHKTAGIEGRNLTYALEDLNIKIHKRVFLTATPRHYRPHNKDNKNKKGGLVFSMDRPEVYGPRVYSLPFSRAIEMGIICRYKVIISAICSTEVNAELLRRGTVNVNGDEVYARQVANQISICDAVKKYGVKKIFTFHNKVESAKSFVAKGSEGIVNHLQGYLSMHVNGEMSTSEREKIIKNFKSAPAALISNARCLTEGVDVPAVDMVAFLSPRRSVVDIVQAAGRAMRRSDNTGKTMGYILVPLYVEQASGEKIEEAVARADYTDVWEVLNSLMEHDDMLHESIRSEATGVRRIGSTGRDYIDEVVDVNMPSVSLDSLRRTISTNSIEALYSAWDTNYGELVKYKKDYGHCNVPAPGVIGNPHKELGAWVAAQRAAFNKGRITEDRVALLLSLGFVFDYQDRKTDETWNKWYLELKKYREKHGDCRIPRTYKIIPELASWVWIQRIRRDKKYGKAEKLTEHQIQLLDEIDFTWDPRDLAWEKSYKNLVSYHEKHGDSLVSTEEPRLYAWCKVQRANAASGKLPKARLDKLLKIGFIIDNRKYQAELENQYRINWLSQFAELKTYKETNGHCDVPSNRTKGPMKKLSAWVINQRRQHKEGFLKPEYYSALSSIGFRFVIRTDVGSWEDRLNEAKEFILEFGHCDVPRGYKKYPKLGGFVNAVRVQHNNGTLSPVKLASLNSINFNWEALSRDRKDSKFKANIERLIRFKETHGKTAFPDKNSDPAFYRWITYLRSRDKSGLIPNDLRDKLVEIGFFEKNLHYTYWESNFKKLQDYKKVHGHVRVPKGGHVDSKFSNWVRLMRYQVRNKMLTEDKAKMLIEIGILESSLSKTPWETHFAKLQEYKRKYGHVRVPKDGNGDRTFGQWVATMRHQVKTGGLPIDKKKKLIKIGILEESTNYIPWEKRYVQLQEYKRKYGHVRVPIDGNGDRTFGQWVATMRHQVKTKKLPPDKVEQLVKLGILEK